MYKVCNTPRVTCQNHRYSLSNYVYFQVIPYVKLLFYKLEKLPRRGTCRLRQQLIQKTTRYFRGGDDRESFPDIEATEVHAIATLLDPRFRKSSFASSTKADTAAAVLLDLVKEVDESVPCFYS